MKSVYYGVPQASILGSLLFLIFVRDLSNSTLLNPIMFADDINLFFSHKNIKSLYEFVNREFVNIKTWMGPSNPCQHGKIDVKLYKKKDQN